MNNQRFCVLPSGRRPNLASAALSRSVRRLNSDVETVYGHPVLLVETFTDPSRHAGTCNRAANFVEVGETSGYARRNGRWVDDGQPKRCWLSPLRPDAAGVLAAGFDHPALRAHDDRKADMVEVNQVVIEDETGLYAKLCAIADHRTPKGIRHELASILLVCAVAMLAGTGHVTGIAERAGDLPEELLLRLHLRRSPTTNKVRPPSLSTLKRALAAIDRDALDRIVCDTLEERCGPGEHRPAVRSEADLAQGPLLPTARHPAPPATVTATPAAMTEAGAARPSPAKSRQCCSGCRSTASRSAVHARPTGGQCTCSRR